MRWRFTICRTALIILALLMFDAEARTQTAEKVKPPAHRVVFQPLLLWQDAKHSYQGTGFFAKTPKGNVVGVTSAHFLNKEGPPLVGAAWMDIRTGYAVCAFTKSLGVPGRGEWKGKDGFDLRDDYLIMPADGVDTSMALDLDGRKHPEKGERVWLPNKSDEEKLGFSLVEGAVVTVSPEYLAVECDEPIELQSQSGSPFISQRTGDVVGILAGAQTMEGKQQIFLTPASALLAAIATGKDHPPLASVVGKARGPEAPTDPMEE